MTNRRLPNSVEVVCFPLYSILLALDQIHVDYFSLDVEGLEFEVLKTIPFDKIDITVSIFKSTEIAYDSGLNYTKTLLEYSFKLW